jgi:hypothetical protein
VTRTGVREVDLPDASLLRRYAGGGGHADAYAVEVDHLVTFEEFVAAFYSTRLFALERFVLMLAGRPSSPSQARLLARGGRDRFAAWTVEARGEAQLLLADDTGRTRSWLMSEPLDGFGTRLYFGSAVLPRHDARSGERRLGQGFRALLRFHRHYSRALLRAAVRALKQAA